MAGAGVYAGAGGGLGVGHSDGPLKTEFGASGYAEADAGFVESININATFGPHDNISGVGGAIPIKPLPGIGGGVYAGVGLQGTLTVVVPVGQWAQDIANFIRNLGQLPHCE